MFWNCQCRSAKPIALQTLKAKVEGKTLLHLFTDLFRKDIFLTLPNNCKVNTSV